MSARGLVGTCSPYYEPADFVDIVSDGLVYSSGHTTMTLNADPTSPVTIPVIGVFVRVTEGPEAGKIRIMTIYEDHMPFMQKLQAMAGQGK